MLAKNKLGKVYISRDSIGRRRRHRASAPGQTAANRTGRLRKARSFKLRGSDQLEFGFKSGLGADYAKFVEEGTRNMGARPGLRNTVKAVRRTGTTGFARSIELELEK